MKSIIEPITYDISERDSGLANWLLDISGSPVVQNIIACILLFLQTAYLNRIVIRNRLAREITLLPGLCFVLLCSLMPQYTLLSPHLIANTFVLIAIGQIFQTYKTPSAAGLIFNSGFALGLASLIEPSYIYLLLIVFISILILRSFKMRELFQFLIGYILVLFFYFGIGYLIDYNFDGEAMKFVLNPNYDPLKVKGVEIYKLIGFGLLAMFTVMNYSKYTLKKSIQAQKKIDILFWFAVASLVYIFFSNHFQASSIMLLFIPLAVFLSINLVTLKSNFLQEIIHVGVLVLLALFHFGVI